MVETHAHRIASRLGHEVGSVDSVWGVKEALLYAVAVGGNLPGDERFLLESFGPALLPTFATVVEGSWQSMLSRTMYPGLPMLNGGFEYRIHRPLPVEGRATTSVRLVGIEAKQALTILWHETSTVDGDGNMLLSGRHSLLLRETRGFSSAGSPGYDAVALAPIEDPELLQEVHVDERAIILYRPLLPVIAGEAGPDRVHTDHRAALAAGLPRPLLHSTSVIGHVGLAITRALPFADAREVRGFGGQFRHPLFPGDRLLVRLRRADAEGAVWSVSATNDSGSDVLRDCWMELAR